MKVKKIVPRMVLDSRGFPTVECDLHLNSNKLFGRASVPSGASTGEKEALELRDGNTRQYNGKGVEKAISNITNIIAPNLYNKTFENFKQVDNFLCELDGTENKSNLGANSVLAVSLAFARAQSMVEEIPLHKLLSKTYGIKSPDLPKPMFNVINGGAHAHNNLDIQEFMVMPRFEDYRQNLQAGCEIIYALKEILQKNGYTTNVGDEGGFAPQLKSNVHALDLIEKAVEATGYKFGSEIKICLDIAASELYKAGANGSGKYFFQHEDKAFNAEELVEFYEKLCRNYPIFSIEDAMDQNDLSGWKMCSEALCGRGSKGLNIQLVGDDLFVTNPRIFSELAQQGLANAILIKPNQIGTLTEALEVVMHAKKVGYNTVISHRSGETEDTSIAHIAFGMNAGQIKTGAPVRTDRTAKFNELLRFC